MKQGKFVKVLSSRDNLNEDSVSQEDEVLTSPLKKSEHKRAIS